MPPAVRRDCESSVSMIGPPRATPDAAAAVARHSSMISSCEGIVSTLATAPSLASMYSSSLTTAAADEVARAACIWYAARSAASASAVSGGGGGAGADDGGSPEPATHFRNSTSALSSNEESGAFPLGSLSCA